MKKLNYLLLGLAGLSLISCSQDDISGPDKGDGNVKITVNLPSDVATRAGLGSGAYEKNLQYAVYLGEEYQYGETMSIGNDLSAEIPFTLLSDNNYTIVFFAESTDNDAYTFNTQEATLSVDYSKMNSKDNNDDLYDCFYKAVDVKGGETSSINVTLSRPVGQVNWGTSDLTAYNDIISTFNVYYTQNNGVNTVTSANVWTTLSANVPTSMNLLTGEAVAPETGAMQTIGTFAAPISQAFPVDGYTYIGAQYVLVGKSSSIYDMKLTIANAEESSAANYFSTSVDVNSVPMQGNYRTNIYGTLLTNVADISIDLNSNWEGSNDDTDYTTSTVIEASNLNGYSIGESGLYKLSGTVTTQDYIINVASGLDVTVDGSGLTLANEDDVPNFYFTSDGLPNAPADVTAAKERTGTYTYQNFNAGVLSIKTGNTTVNVTNNNLNYLDLGAGNLYINITGNNINGKDAEYKRWDGRPSDCGIYLYMIDYDLVFDNNTIINAGGNPLQINGWAANEGSDWTVPALLNLNRIQSFSNNTITVTEYKADKSSWTAAIVFYGDGTYYWTNTSTTEPTFTEAFNTFMQLVKDSNNKFYIGGNAVGANTFKLSQLTSGDSYRFDEITQRAE